MTRISRQFCIVLALLYGLMLSAMAAPSSVQYTRTVVDGVSLHVITVDLNDQSLLLTPFIAIGTEDQRCTFSDFLKENQSLAQITGTYFDLQTGEPIGDVVIRGQQEVYSMGMGSALVVTPENIPAIIDPPRNLEPRSWKGYESVLQGGLRLVTHGKATVDPEGQGFHDRYMQRNTSRIAVGILPGHRVVMMESGHALLPLLAQIMVDLGCTDAMALDGGGSTSIAYDKRSIMASGRRLANVLAVVQRPADETAIRIAADKVRKTEQARLAAKVAHDRAQAAALAAAAIRIEQVRTSGFFGLLLGACGLLALAIVIIRRRCTPYQYPQAFYATKREALYRSSHSSSVP